MGSQMKKTIITIIAWIAFQMIIKGWEWVKTSKLYLVSISSKKKG